MKSAGGAQPAYAAGRTEPLTPVLKSPNECARRGKEKAKNISKSGRMVAMHRDGTGWSLGSGHREQ